MSLVVSKVGRKKIIDDIKTAAGAIDGLIVHLFKQAHVPSPTDTEADYTPIEADFTSYAASTAIVWGAAFFDENETCIVVGDNKQFEAGVIVTPNTIYGAYVVDGTGKLVYAETFDPPIPIANQYDAVVYTPRFSFGQ